MASTSITGDGRSAIERSLPVTSTTAVLLSELASFDWETVFEIARCLDWILRNSFNKICLQFPDEYLVHSTKIVESLEKQTGKRCFILADSTYGSCCVDEKTAQHVPDADALIHFGPSCLSPSSGRIPVLYAFTRPPLDLALIHKLFTDEFSPDDKIIMMYDVVYHHAAYTLFGQLISAYKQLKISDVAIPGEDSCKVLTGIRKHGRIIPLTDESEVESHKIFFIGNRALPNLLLELPRNSFKVYDPTIKSTDSLSNQTSSINRLIRKRNYYVEKIKDATSVGILVGTLVVQNYLSVIERLKSILKQAGKKFYTVSIGEINPCKLGNFMDIDVFVFVGCPEVVNYYLSDDSKGQFFQPILTPYDVELAFCSVDEKAIGQEYIIDWNFLIEKGEPNVKDVEDDVSLITGQLRSSRMIESNVKGSENQVINWVGLDINEESPSIDPSQIHQGRSGIASSYADEPLVS